MNAKFWSLGILAALCGLLVAGCPSGGTDDNDNGGGTGATALAGTWSGEIECSTVQFVGDTGGSPSVTRRTFTITIDAEGFPTEVEVLGFSSAPDLTADLSRSGDSDTLTSTSSGLSITEAVRVDSATYTETSAIIVIDIDYSALGGALNQEGTGRQTIELQLNGDSLEYSVSVEYDVVQLAAGIELNTGETVDCTGVLEAQ